MAKTNGFFWGVVVSKFSKIDPLRGYTPTQIMVPLPGRPM
jgi:hypothetical protein